jgi:UV DNA damage endonuclease
VVTPKIHYSSPRLDIEVRRTHEGRSVRERIVIPPLRAHADLVDPIAFEAFLKAAGPGRQFDVMLEAKAKDVALIELRRQLDRVNS